MITHPFPTNLRKHIVNNHQHYYKTGEEEPDDREVINENQKKSSVSDINHDHDDHDHTDSNSDADCDSNSSKIK